MLVIFWFYYICFLSEHFQKPDAVYEVLDLLHKKYYEDVSFNKYVSNLIGNKCGLAGMKYALKDLKNIFTSLAKNSSETAFIFFERLTYQLFFSSKRCIIFLEACSKAINDASEKVDLEDPKEVIGSIFDLLKVILLLYS